MGDIILEELIQTPVDQQQCELVERKGLGHPDSICDAIVNHASVALCAEYQKEFGRILHHNLDKAMLVAGVSHPQLGGGHVETPMRFIFGDRATAQCEGKSIDCKEIVVEAAKDWVRNNLRFVEPDRHIVFQNEIKAGSAQLAHLVDFGQSGANDTSAAVGFAPFSPTERIVLGLERYLNSTDFKSRFPESGEDVKVMGFRHARELRLTVAVAFIDRFVQNSRAYLQRKNAIWEDLSQYLCVLDFDFERIAVEVNVLDDPKQGDDGMYLTVLGTSAEGADSGQVGRGNRANGLISINRPQSIEAHAGKNPVNHIGKIYSYFTNHVAQKIYSEVEGIREVYVHLCSQIGRPISDPLAASLRFILDSGVVLEDVKHSAESILVDELARINEFTALLATDEFYAFHEAPSHSCVVDSK